MCVYVSVCVYICIYIYTHTYIIFPQRQTTKFLNPVFIICLSKVKDKRNLKGENDDSYLECWTDSEHAERDPAS